MIQFKKEAYDSLDTVLTKLGTEGGDRPGWSADVTTVEGEVIYAQIVGPVDEKWWDRHNGWEGATRHDILASWPVRIQRLDSDGEPIGGGEDVIATKVTVL